jgi:monoamine oxidase
MRYPISRREFLKDTALTAAALSTSSPLDLLAASPKTFERIGPPKKVIVVGAGLGGLSAAYELTQAGHDVTILEAQMRPGGHVLTLRQPFSDGLYAEAGAARFPDTHDLTLKYVKLFGLTLDPFYPSELTAKQYSVQYYRGRRFTLKPGEKFNFLAHFPFDLTPEEKKLGYEGLWQKYEGPVLKEMGDPTAPGWPPDSLKKYDHMDTTEFLRQQGASPGAIEAMTWWAADPEDLNRSTLRRLAFHVVRLKRDATKHVYKIRGGTDLLPKAFAARLAEKIHYGAPVVRIEHDARSVRVVFLQAGAQQAIAGDYLICAIPFSVLKDVEVSLPFTTEKQRAIQDLPYHPATRVFLQSRKRYWLEEGFDGFAGTDVLGEVWHPTWDQPGPRGILSSFLWVSRARHLTVMTEGERVNYTLEHMEKIFPGIREHFEGGVTKSWGDDPWARGCSFYLKPGQVTSLLPHIARPEGRVHFAGTHTSRRGGLMQGALESGNRAAREVNEAP